MGPPEVSINGVEVLEELGRGAHSVVYRIRRARRFYALKLPTPTPSASDATTVTGRFLREAVALARVRHSALPQVMEVGQVGRVPYIIMELVAGETLAERLRRGALEEERVIDLGLQLSGALAKIHDAGLAHRDIKAQNILFDSLSSAVRLIDFGFVEPSAGPPTPDLTGSTQSSSSPRTTPDFKEDLRALGAVLFQCATGQAPFAEVDPRPVLERRGSKPDLPARLSPQLSGILSRLLLDSPEGEYRDARALASDLARSPTSAASPAGTARDQPGSGPIPLLGRERELGRLRSALRTSTGGASPIVVVRGPRGSGKTRLMQALLEETASSHRSTVAASEQSQSEPLGAIRSVVEGELAAYERLSPSARLQAIARFRSLAAGVAPVLRLLSPRLAHLLRTGEVSRPNDEAGLVSDEALAEFVARLLGDGPPRILVFDDVQWLDAGSRRVLSHLTAKRSPRVLYLLAARDDSASWADFARTLRTLDMERIWEVALDPLDEEKTAQLLSAYLAVEQAGDDLLRFVLSVGNGTPLSIFQVLHTMLESGALVPHWGTWKLDPAITANLELPKGSVELLARRIAALPAATVAVLTTAAVVGMECSQRLLARACDLSEVDVNLALGEARRAMLVTATETGHRFVHDSVREALLARLDPAGLASIHQSVAEALDDDGEGRAAERSHLTFSALIGLPASGNAGNDPEWPDGAGPNARKTYELASHYADGLWERKPRRVLEVCLDAAHIAFRTFDNELALRFFDVARRCARLLAQELGLDFELAVAEVHLRMGSLEPAIERLNRVAEGSTDPIQRAHAFSRMAWAEAQLDVDRAWAALFAGFSALDAPAPTGSLGGVFKSLLRWLGRASWRRVGWRTRLAPAAERPRLRVLCQLHDQATRLAVECARPSRLLQAVLANLPLAERLGPSTALSNSYLSYSFVLTLLGMRTRSRRYLQVAESVAKTVDDPVVYARLLQVRAVIAAWGGDMREALQYGARSLDEYGHWRELSDYCLTACTQAQIEGVRGRCLDAWRWLEHAVSKLGKHEGATQVLEFVELSVRASLTAVGRDADADVVLSRLSNVSARTPTRGALAVANYGSRIRAHTECGDLADGFEALVAEVEALKLDPRKVHLAATEYYVHVAHARVHACLRAETGERPAKLFALKRALADLTRAARIPLFWAHVRAIEAYVAMFEAKRARSEKLFSLAYRLGADEGAPWVLYAVHRGRAHALRERGFEDSAHDEARLAEALAREHGAAYRLRWIREEFALSPRGSLSSSEASPFSPKSRVFRELEAPRSPPRARGYLKSLVRIGQHATREFGVAEQARLVLSELIDAVRAERGFLFLTEERMAATSDERDEALRQSEPAIPLDSRRFQELVAVARLAAGGRELPADTTYDHGLLLDTFSAAASGIDDSSLPHVVNSLRDERTVLVVSLAIRGERMGVVYLDRSRHGGTFDDSDSRLLAALSIQVPLVFELARFLRDRERAHETERSAEKLEAIARLAGGIAHDFNNMLSVILSVSDQILTHRSTRNVDDDMRTVQSAAERARDLTQQLLAFSRGQYLRPEILNLNELVERLAPLFRQLLGEHRELVLRLDPGLCRVKADPAQIDQVLTNLIVNARDAMPAGGEVVIESANQTLAAGRGAEELRLAPGRYARLTVSDTGSGMDSTTLAHAFEPFFTTKPDGNGLGLPTAYGIVKQSGGHIDVESRPELGTSFRILLPETEQRQSQPAPPLRPSDHPGRETVLLVDDEPLVREATRRTLRSLGYQVIGAKSADDALKLAAEHATTIDLVITDVMMPGMNGLELARELGKLRPSLKVLFISGYTAGVLAERGFLRESVDFVQKPVARDALAARIRELLDGRPAPS
jgi:eukaryotic-like serine/threonine-protein kinase